MRVSVFSSIAVFSIFAAGVLAFAAIAFAGVSEGKGIFDSKNCGGCHQIQGPAKEKTIEDMLTKKAPELWYAGSKFRKEFLEKWLKDPKPIRPMEFYSLTKKNGANHAKLDAKAAKDVSDYLMSLKSSDVKAANIQPKSGPQGRVVFEKKQGCYGCHEVKKGAGVVGGLTGPTLVGAGDRLNPDWIYAYLTNPKVFKPVKDMPVYTGALSDSELKNLAEFVAGLK
ncbi:MAG: c-type cytochrome [Deltaproteobacteria bacterium]|nr:c-type cytochrome [Deltaproteobacteria bacterium]